MIPKISFDHQASEQNFAIGMFIYLLIGIPVVRLHIRQQKMSESVKSLDGSQTTEIVLYTLASLWPLLLLAMILNYLQPSPRSRRTAKEEPSTDAQSDATIGKRE